MLRLILELVVAYVVIAFILKLIRAAMAGYAGDAAARRDRGEPRARTRSGRGERAVEAEWEEIKEDPPPPPSP